jgi:Holliday junction resolvasome RuvABC endonuclease subunit
MILAIDPSIANYGCSVINTQGKVINVGTIHTKKATKKLLRVADDEVQRITYITAQLSQVIQKYQIQGVVGELPPSGSKSVKAARGLAMAMALSVALFTEHKLPVEWATPIEVKQAMTGRKDASKEDMMLAACKRYGWKVSEKIIRPKQTRKIQRTDRVYHPLGKTMGKNDFEHIADSLGAYEALKHTNVVRMYVQVAA